MRRRPNPTKWSSKFGHSLECQLLTQKHISVWRATNQQSSKNRQDTYRQSKKFSWKNHDKLMDYLKLEHLEHMHMKMSTGEILPHRKPNKKQDTDPKAWRPIMCLTVLRKLFSKIIRGCMTWSIHLPSSWSPHSPLDSRRALECKKQYLWWKQPCRGTVC